MLSRGDVHDEALVCVFNPMHGWLLAVCAVLVWWLSRKCRENLCGDYLCERNKERGQDGDKNKHYNSSPNRTSNKNNIYYFRFAYFVVKFY